MITPMFRRSVLVLLAGLVLLMGQPAGAQEGRFIDVIKVSGPLDDRIIDLSLIHI